MPGVPEATRVDTGERNNDCPDSILKKEIRELRRFPGKFFFFQNHPGNFKKIEVVHVPTPTNKRNPYLQVNRNGLGVERNCEVTRLNLVLDAFLTKGMKTNFLERLYKVHHMNIMY